MASHVLPAWPAVSFPRGHRVLPVWPPCASCVDSRAFPAWPPCASRVASHDLPAWPAVCFPRGQTCASHVASRDLPAWPAVPFLHGHRVLPAWPGSTPRSRAVRLSRERVRQETDCGRPSRWEPSAGAERCEMELGREPEENLPGQRVRRPTLRAACGAGWRESSVSHPGMEGLLVPAPSPPMRLAGKGLHVSEVSVSFHKKSQTDHVRWQLAQMSLS